MHVLLRIAALTAALVMTGPGRAADLLITNVNGYSLDRNGKLFRFEALLIEDGKLLATGNSADLRARAGQARVVDGQGRSLLPGLIDAHGHVMGLGQMKNQADLTQAKSLDATLAKVRAYAAQNKDAAWLRGRGWNQVIWKLGRFPTAQELDAAVADRPVWLERVDGHAGWANSAALKKAGIDAQTPDPSGGRIERDANGAATGILVDAAMGLVESVIPALTEKQNEKALDAALLEMASLGLTSVHDAGIDAATYKRYRRYADAGRLTTRIYAMIGGTGADFDRIAKSGPLPSYRDDFLSVRSVKLYADGALGSRGAALLAPYADDPGNKGLLFSTQAEMTAMLIKAMTRGFQANVHAIGDGGNRLVLDSFSAAYAAGGGAELRNRIEHAQVVTLDDIGRFAKLSLIASMQPTHATSDMNMAEDRVGAERIQGAYAWQRMLQNGVRIAAGSDFPVESANPFFGLHAAVTRQDQQNEPPGGWYPEQALSLATALRAFTLDAAYAAHQEHILGSLEPGKWADFILIDRDIFSAPPRELWATRVLETWVAGKRVYAAAAAPSARP